VEANFNLGDKVVLKGWVLIGTPNIRIHEKGVIIVIRRIMRFYE
jgi:hypothetical protein